MLVGRALHSPQKLGKNGCVGGECETSVSAAAALSRLARESGSSAKTRLRSKEKNLDEGWTKLGIHRLQYTQVL